MRLPALVFLGLVQCTAPSPAAGPVPGEALMQACQQLCAERGLALQRVKIKGRKHAVLCVCWAGRTTRDI